MKRFIVLALLCSLAAPSYADPAFDLRQNLSGLWSDVNTDAFQNGYMVLAQDGYTIHVAHYVEWQGKPLVEYGSGKREGDKIVYSVKVTRPIPGWAVAGVHTLTVSDDGNMLNGKYETPDGGSGSLTFKRKGK